MPLLDDEPTVHSRRLLRTGLPLFLLALVLSILIHQTAHSLVYKKACGGQAGPASVPSLVREDRTECPAASLAGTIATFATAIASFAVYARNTRRLFWGSMAFVNAAIRIPSGVAVFLQLLIGQKSDLAVDESVALRLLHQHDPAVSILLICFYSLTLLFLAITIVHDTRILPGKWMIASCLFVGIIPLELLIRRALGMLPL
ncbi:MAG TPA: hypothetical protein VMW43_00400 [Bacteroidota bacterium]|nr:hypothetical protein [Bacteroidota bacterium]